jgi:glyoxylase-like metal-dependent hydrolase (beta-lactamase superfamily II)
MKIGDIDVLPIVDGYLTFPKEPDYPGAGSPDYAAHLDSLQPDGRRRMTLGGFLVSVPRAPGRLMLVDAGSGPSTGNVIRPARCSCPSAAHHAILAYHDLLGFDDALRERHLAWLADTATCPGRLLQSLASVGVAPEDITDVVLPHMHFDHIGWGSGAKFKWLILWA